MNGKNLGGRTITVELSGRPPKEGEAGGPPRRDDRSRGPPPRDDYRADQRGSFGGAGGGNSRSLGSSDTATRNIFVANIPPETTEQDVQAHFSKYGPVLGVKFLPKKSDTIAAFVDFQNVDDAREAHDSVNMINGIKIRTDYNTRRANNPPPGGPSLDRYDDRDRGPPPRDSYYDRAPPAAARYRDEYEDRGPPPRYRDDPPPRYREEYDRPPPPRYEVRDRCRLYR